MVSLYRHDIQITLQFQKSSVNIVMSLYPRSTTISDGIPFLVGRAFCPPATTSCSM